MNDSMNRLPLYLHLFCSTILTITGILWPVAQIIAGRVTPLGLVLGFGMMVIGLKMAAQTVKDYRQESL